MGLDMYGFKPIKISLEDLSHITKTSDIVNDYYYLSKEDVNNEDRFKELKPYMILKELETNILDIDAIKKNYPNFDDIVCYYGQDSATFRMKDGTKEEISNLSKYITTVKKEFYIYSCYEIAY